VHRCDDLNADQLPFASYEICTDSCDERYHLLEMQRTNLAILVVVAAIGALIVGSMSVRAEQVDPQRLKTTSAPLPQPSLIIRADELFPITPPARPAF